MSPVLTGAAVRTDASLVRAARRSFALGVVRGGASSWQSYWAITVIEELAPTISSTFSDICALPRWSST